MYYVLDCEPLEDDEGGCLEIDDQIELDGVESWSEGFWMDLELPNPIEIQAVPIREYQGRPSDMLDQNMCFMSEPLVRALQEAGVDNLQLVPAVFKNSQTGQTWPYFAVNILGLVDAADLERSKWTSDQDPLQGEVRFEKLVIDQETISGLLMFRLAQHKRTILIHESVRARLEKASLHGLVFVDPKEWKT